MGEEDRAELLLPDQSTFISQRDDIPPITGALVFLVQFYVESKRLWYLAAPATFTTLCQYSLGAVTQLLAGHVSTIAIAAVSIENNVIAGFSMGIMLGMGSALETLCGQAFGAGKPEMLGVYMQRSWIILNSSALLLALMYVFSAHILKLIGQTTAISDAAGTLAVWMIPQVFASAFSFPITKFLQSQSKVLVLAAIAFATLILHTVFSWLLMLRLGWGLVGAAIVLNASWWLSVLAQMGYIVTGSCGRAWSGFSIKAFHNLWGFLRLSFASAIMICLETWYFMALILFAGYLKDAEVSVDAFSICMSILTCTIMVSIGFSAAVSVRVSNELGAAHPRTAKFSVVVAVANSFMVAIIISFFLILFRDKLPSLFTTNNQVKDLVCELIPLLSLTIILNNIQPVLSGVAVGAGWQAVIAYVNIGCYYFFGLPVGLILAYCLGMGVRGIWYGMTTGILVQSCILVVMVCKTNWSKEASMAGDRIRQWGGEVSQNVGPVELNNQ